mmetsp:Transcript_57985/g.138060  ORF Transcript_57985/g.138060 Transcript_57985/m.138060 type:complete len:167 (-) Transcript_57985:577-1077(-)
MTTCCSGLCSERVSTSHGGSREALRLYCVETVIQGSRSTNSFSTLSPTTSHAAAWSAGSCLAVTLTGVCKFVSTARAKSVLGGDLHSLSRWQEGVRNAHPAGATDCVEGFGQGERGTLKRISDIGGDGGAGVEEGGMSMAHDTGVIAGADVAAAVAAAAEGGHGDC